MRFDEYQAMAARTINPDLPKAEQLNHALFEIASEVGEIHAIYQKRLQGHRIDEEHLVEEIGDVLWGLAELCTVYGFDLGEVAMKNIYKLRKRYPDGFQIERSLHREE